MIRILWLGIGLQVSSLVFQGYWHATRGAQIHNEVLHWLIYIGMFVAAIGGALAWRRTNGVQRYAVTVAVAGSGIQFGGYAWNVWLTDIQNVDLAMTALPKVLPVIGLFVILFGAVGESGIRWRENRSLG